MNIGYPCLNLSLKEKNVYTNRGMIKSTYVKKGLSYVSELVVQNLQDLKKILEWNYLNDIFLFRMSSDMFPWMSEYSFEELPDYLVISNLLNDCGSYAKNQGMRLTFHPGPFNVLASENQRTVNNTVKDLNQHSAIMDMMNLDVSPFNKINIHIETNLSGIKEQALTNFVENFNLLHNNAQKRLTIENDDKISMFTVKDLYHGIHKKIHIPIVFDYHHHQCNPGTETEKEALELAISTWGTPKIKPVVHVSEPKSDGLFRAHADYIQKPINLYGYDLDVMFEAKQKEKAVQYYTRQFFNKS